MVTPVGGLPVPAATKLDDSLHPLLVTTLEEQERIIWFTPCIGCNLAVPAGCEVA